MIGYAIRLSANAVLQREIAHLLVRPADWSSRRPIVSYYDFTYQAQSWSISRRVVAKVEWHQGELFPRVGFIVTNLSYPPKGIVRFYNGRGSGAVDQGGQVRPELDQTVLSQVRGQPGEAMAVRSGVQSGKLHEKVGFAGGYHWTLTSLQTRLIKTGGRLVRHARRMVFQLAEVLVTGKCSPGY